MQIEHPYLMFLGDAADQLAAKTAQGIVHWRRDWCVGQLRLDDCNANLGLPEMTIAEAAAAGVRTLVIGVANRGGVISESWIETILAAIGAGMDVASGLHARITDIPGVADAAAANGGQLFDVRHPTETFEVGSGVRRPGKRLLAVGTDCSVGKMYTALAIDAELTGRPFFQGKPPESGWLHHGQIVLAIHMYLFSKRCPFPQIGCVISSFLCCQTTLKFSVRITLHAFNFRTIYNARKKQKNVRQSNAVSHLI